MRKLLLLILISVLVFGCKKDEQVNDKSTQVDVSFNANLVDPGSMKDWICKTDTNGIMLEPDYAKILIDGEWYYPLVYRIDGDLFTQNIKLDIPSNFGAPASKTFTVEEFYLYKDVGTIGDYTDDELLIEYTRRGSPFAALCR